MEPSQAGSARTLAFAYRGEVASVASREGNPPPLVYTPQTSEAAASSKPAETRSDPSAGIEAARQKSAEAIAAYREQSALLSEIEARQQNEGGVDLAQNGFDMRQRLLATLA